MDLSLDISRKGCDFGQSNLLQLKDHPRRDTAAGNTNCQKDGNRENEISVLKRNLKQSELISKSGENKEKIHHFNLLIFVVLGFELRTLYLLAGILPLEPCSQS
jgi:hypothetical protein